MPLQDITFRSNNSPKPSIRGLGEWAGLVRKNDASPLIVKSVAREEPTKERYPSDPTKLLPTTTASYPPPHSSLSSINVDNRKQYCVPVGTDTTDNELTCYDDWESMLLCQPLQTSIGYLFPSDASDKRSTCLLCRGVSVQTGSEVRHCRGRSHRTAYTLLQTLDTMEQCEREQLHQHFIVKNGQKVTAWKCRLCDTKSLSHEYMIKHLHGKKHRYLANQELQLEDWTKPVDLFAQTSDFEQFGQLMLPEDKGFHNAPAESRSCFYSETGQTQLQRLHGRNPLNRLIRAAREQQSVSDSLDQSQSVNASPMFDPGNVVKFLGLFSPTPKKPKESLMSPDRNLAEDYETIIKHLDQRVTSLSPFRYSCEGDKETTSEALQDALRSVQDFVDGCLSSRDDTSGIMTVNDFFCPPNALWTTSTNNHQEVQASHYNSEFLSLFHPTTPSDEGSVWHCP